MFIIFLFMIRFDNNSSTTTTTILHSLAFFFFETGHCRRFSRRLECTFQPVIDPMHIAIALYLFTQTYYPPYPLCLFTIPHTYVYSAGLIHSGLRVTAYWHH